jgi:cytoplasmic iron level regulating protein YaaA (DUF328/UPF0246 family)
MRILLPPSEGKTPPSAGPPLDLAQLSFPALSEVRSDVLGTLMQVCSSDPQAALHALGLRPSQLPEVQRDAVLAEQPCAPAGRVYTGVLFAALAMATLPPGVADEHLLIASGLFGLLRPSDPIPAYRLSGSARLPGLPAPKRLWSQALATLLDPLAQEHLLVDLRSQPYANLYRGRTPRWVPVRVMTVRNGRRVAVSHHNKATKGALARCLLLTGAQPHSATELMELLRDTGWAADLDTEGGLEVLIAV